MNGPQRHYSDAPLFIACLCLRLAALAAIGYVLGLIGKYYDDIRLLFIHFFY